MDARTRRRWTDMARAALTGPGSTFASDERIDVSHGDLVTFRVRQDDGQVRMVVVTTAAIEEAYALRYRPTVRDLGGQVEQLTLDA